ncbi:hydrophobin-domain-containing protein [Armillaria solidipes]|uniref:Hydrophobin n=1 Tax=Armillaria solidipes TaxID=1076256 RepID=A0A2H3ASU1_9AGAR|nr:hydrophobin-domain-containing protein [Armillaria solidipes]
MFAQISFTALLALPLLATAGLIPSGLIPSGILPTGILPAGAVPTGIIPTGIIPTLPTGIIPTLPTGIIPPGIIPTGVIPSGGGEGAACATGSAQCCDSTQSPTDLTAPVSTLLGTLGVVVGQLTGSVGVSCTPITVIGLGSTQCSNQVVCCDSNNYNGLVSLGCTPLSAGL